MKFYQQSYTYVIPLVVSSMNYNMYSTGFLDEEDDEGVMKPGLWRKILR